MDSVLFQGMVVSRKVFNENSKLGELSRGPYHSDSPIGSQHLFCGRQPTPQVLPNKLSGSQKVQAINKSLSVPLLFFFFPRKRSVAERSHFLNGCGLFFWWNDFFVSGCQGESWSTREPVLCSGPGRTDRMSSDVPKGQPFVPRRSQAEGETPGWPEFCSSPTRRRVATQDPREQEKDMAGKMVSQTTGLWAEPAGRRPSACLTPQSALPSPLLLCGPGSWSDRSGSNRSNVLPAHLPSGEFILWIPPWGTWDRQWGQQRGSRRSFLEILTSQFWWLLFTLVPLGREVATAQCHPWVSLHPAHIFANTVSPLHMKEFHSERGLVSLVWSLSPTNLAWVPN